jgi:hypothetical protein
MESAPEAPHSPYLSICNGWGGQWLRHVGVGEQLRLDFEYAQKFSDADRGYLVPQSATRWSQEPCALPWSLGEACDAGGLVTVWANTLLTRPMHVVAQGGSERFFVRDAKAETNMWVDRIAERHQAFAWMHDCSAVGFSFSVAVWQYTLARAGCCIFWEIVSLQEMLQRVVGRTCVKQRSRGRQQSRELLSPTVGGAVLKGHLGLRRTASARGEQVSDAPSRLQRPRACATRMRVL